jgi:hypothetical protein
MAKIRIYKDNEGAIQAQTLKADDELDAQAVVFRVHLPIGHVMAELLFTDMTPNEAQTLGLKDTETLYRALGREGSRVGLQDADEEYYMLQFQLHPVIDKKEKNRIAKKLGEAVGNEVAGCGGRGLTTTRARLNWQVPLSDCIQVRFVDVWGIVVDYCNFPRLFTEKYATSQYHSAVRRRGISHVALVTGAKPRIVNVTEGGLAGGSYFPPSHRSWKNTCTSRSCPGASTAPVTEQQK